MNYMRLMILYFDISIGKAKVRSSRLSCPYVLLECDCTYENMMVYFFFGRPRSLYVMHEECEY